MILIVVLMVLASLTVAVTETADDSYFLQRYTDILLQKEQIMAFADGISAGVITLFSYDDSNVDYYGEYWTYPVPFSLHGIGLNVEIEDEERYLNPNILVENGKVNEKAREIFNRLFEITGIGSEMTEKLIEWIAPSDVDDGLKHAPFDTTEEIKLIEGVTPEIYNGRIEDGEFKPGLRSLLSVWSSGKVNINTASKWILMALDSEIDENLAAKIISYREKKPFKKVDDLINVDGVTSDIIYRIKPFADVRSSHFLARAQIDIGDTSYTVEILFVRSGGTLKEVWRRIR
ncbi:general secretion pathway protein GspK [Desulfurobacterium atlanticum]|uniref:General secretion pathway protein K n=1 Tax=Desulfurobacterium atlanticum TaxID=240169 RepID=A0A238ZC36_9BACT|nr:helix-hairpin-helix domain-containing protein [Desulfurobacterium atlanticum]SNR80501.1 general secretion pathway protein K [Desulfurobacterium atlanticum]